MATLFTYGRCVVVTTRGPGKLHLLSYQSNGGIPNHIGSVQTTNSGLTRYMLSHSHSFEKFAFYWDGAGPAVYAVGTDLDTHILGKSWNHAALIAWGTTTVTTGSVPASLIDGAIQRDEMITAFIIPDLI